jgi:uncharacterized protein YdbL (DUF1318 family)
MNRIQHIILVMGGFALALALLISAPVSAGPLQDRMKARLPEIVALKTKGVIGENYQGYLEFVGQSREGANIVAAENEDRKMLYQAIAKKTGATADQVGRRAALKWKANLGPGEYFKNEDGTWIKK